MNGAPVFVAPDILDRFVPWDIEVADCNFGANCGPVSFAAASGREVCRIMRYFDHFEEQPWTNLTQMRQAYAQTGVSIRTLKREWPEYGVALIQWLGPWTEKNFFARWTLPHTHWVAVDGEWVFDYSAPQWMRKQEWAAEIAPYYWRDIPRSTGWAVKYGIQPSNSI